MNERQIKAVKFVKEKGRITNKEYQDIAKVSKPMATIDLRELVASGIFEKRGITGKGTEYIMARANKGLKGLIMG